MARNANEAIDQAVAEGGAYEVIRSRLENQARALQEKVDKVNKARIDEFGQTDLDVIGRVRVRTENNCIARDIERVGDLLLFGYNVFIGLKKETAIEDVFSLYRLVETEGQYEIVTETLAGSFLDDTNFRKHFGELYTYYKNSQLTQLTIRSERLLAVFQIGQNVTDIRVFNWQLNKEGGAVYVDNRGERFLPKPPSHDFEWTVAGREDQVSGRYPHVNILDEVFVETVQGDLTIKVEDNTEVGLGIYTEPVDDKNQGLADAEICYVKLGQLILLRVLPYMEKQHRYLVFNTRSHQVDRIDAIGQACIQLPEDHGIIFPGGYYLQNGDTRSFPDPIEGLEFRRTIPSVNGEDVLYVFFEAITGTFALYSYNLIRKELQNPIYCHGFCLFDDGKAIIFTAEANDATRVHPMQIWMTPYCSDEYALGTPTTNSFSSRIGNKELVRGISDLTSLCRTIRNPQPSRVLYEDMITFSKGLFDAFFWLDDTGAEAVGETVREIVETSELVIDEFQKVESIRAQARKTISDAEMRQKEIVGRIRIDDWNTPEQFVNALDELRNHRGHLITLKEQRYIDRDRIAQLDEEITVQFDSVSAATVSFLSSEAALTPFEDQIAAQRDAIAKIDLVVDLRPAVEELERLSNGLDLLMDVLNSLKVDDATVRTRILEDISGIYGGLNQTKAIARNRMKELGSGEATAEFSAQFRLFSQSITNALSMTDTPQQADEQLSRLLVQLEELESKFSEYDEFLTDIVSKRDELYEAFEARKQALVDDRQRRAHNLANAADRILVSINRRANSFTEPDRLNSYYAADPMVLKIAELVDQLRQLDDLVRADDIEAQLKSAKDQAIRSVQDKLDIYEEGGNVMVLGGHRFSVNSQELELTLLPQEDHQVLHLIGTDYFEPLEHVELSELKPYWEQSLISENDAVYRSEFLAAAIMSDAENRQGSLNMDLLYEAAAADGDLAALVREYAAPRYQEGYEKGVHDTDCVKILQGLLPLRQHAGLLRFAAKDRSLAMLFWVMTPHDEVQKKLWHNHARSAQILADSLASRQGFDHLVDELGQEMGGFFEINSIDCTRTQIASAANYLTRELAAERLVFTISKAAQSLVDGVTGHMQQVGHKKDYQQAMAEYARLGVSSSGENTSSTGRTVSGLSEQLALSEAWLDGFVKQQDVHAGHRYIAEAAALLICGAKVKTEVSSAKLEVGIEDLLGEHPRIDKGVLDLALDEFDDRLSRFAAVDVVNFRRLQELRQTIIREVRQELHLEDFKATPLTTFVRSKLIDEVYLPIIGDNLAKQMGTVGESRRTDLMGLLLLLSPPGYGKTTLMEWLADRLGLVFMAIDCTVLGNDVTSLDPGSASDATAKQQLQRLNQSLEMGNNVMLYLDDIQHLNTEFLQKFVHLCDATRSIEGFWKGISKRYDLKGKRFCVVMAGNPYSESGDLFKIPDMLTNRADTHDLGQIRSGRETQFELSYIENALTQNDVLAPLALRAADKDRFISLAKGEEVATTDFDHQYSSAETNEIITILQHMITLQQVVLKVNEEYVKSSSQADQYLTEPRFKLQGSYRSMNDMAGKITAVMNEEELMQVIDDHYTGEAQTLTTGADQNLLKLAELRGNMTEEEQDRWQEILRSFRRIQSIGGDDQDATTKVVNQLSQVAQSLQDINAGLTSFEDSDLLDPIRQISTTIREFGENLDIEPQQPTAAPALPHKTDPTLVKLVESLTTTLGQQLAPVIESIENKNLIDLDIWERVKNLADDIRRMAAPARKKQD